MKRINVFALFLVFAVGGLLSPAWGQAPVPHCAGGWVNLSGTCPNGRRVTVYIPECNQAQTEAIEARACGSSGGNNAPYSPPYNPLPDLENQLSGLNTQKSNLESQVNGLQQTHSQLQSQINDLSSLISLLQGEISGAEGANQSGQQQLFDLKKAHALNGLKDIGGSGGLGLDGADTADNPLGLKPLTEPDTGAHSVAGPFGEREIVAAFGAPLNTEPQVVVGAWHQLHCGASISRAATVVANSGSIEDVKYLAGQAADAMNGSPVEVPCNQGGAPPVIVNHSTVEQYRAYLPRVMDRITTDTEKLRADKRESRAAQQKVEQAGEQVKQLKAKAAQLQSRPAAPAAQKQQADDALAIAERALAKAQQAKQQADVAASGAQQDLSKIRQANDAVAQHPDQANAIFSQLMGGGGANSPSSR